MTHATHIGARCRLTTHWSECYFHALLVNQLSRQYLSLSQCLDPFRRKSQYLPENRFVIFSGCVNEFIGGHFCSPQPYGWSNPRHPAYVRQVDVAREAALAQVGITIEIFRCLYDARCD